MLRRRSFPSVLTAALFLLIGGANAVVACSSGNASQPAVDGGVVVEPDAGAPALDGSSPPDATLPDAAEDASTVDASDAPADAGNSGVYDFGIDGGDCGVGPHGEPTDLGCTGLYTDWDTKIVSSNLAEYAPGLPFWSDGAQKTRWIYLPPGQPIDTSDMDEWTFPIGTKIWKEFRLAVGAPDASSTDAGDASVETRIETRLLWKASSTFWYRTTYRWSDDGVTSATELTSGELVDAGATGYSIPSQIQCNECHNGRKDGVLGFEAVSLASPAATGLTMAALTSAGQLTSPPDASIVVPGNAVESAALGWLHSNCGTACHNDGYGQAQNTGFFMRLDVATLSSVKTTDTYTTGWNQQTAGFPIPDAAVSYRLHACDLASSCVYYRAGHRDGVDGTPPGTQMPPLDTHLVDTVDLAKVAAWIDEGCDAGD